MFKKEAGGGLRWGKALRANPAVYNHQKKAIDSSNSAVEEEKIWRQPFIIGATVVVEDVGAMEVVPFII